MAELKTKVNDASVTDFINSVEDKQKREDSFVILNMMQKISGFEPKMWGECMIGFGSYHYKSKSGSEGDWFKLGFSPRKQAISLYLLHCNERNTELLADLGKFKTGVGCVYVKRLSDINASVLEKMIANAANRMDK